jgi:hypothetical protein
MTTDRESICRHLGMEFPDLLDLVVVEPTLKPAPPVRRMSDHVGRLYPYGRSLGRPTEYTFHGS